ncbi:MAG: alpha/beta hydrolase [Phycisphaerae bacterium]
MNATQKISRFFHRHLHRSWASGIVICGWICCFAGTGGCGGVDPVENGLATFPVNRAMLLDPRDAGLDYEVHSFRTDHDEVLEGWFIPATNARATILINLGSVTNRSIDQQFNRIFHDLGCNVFVYDYRGFGANYAQGSLETIVPDARAALDFLVTEKPADCANLIVFGYSLGTVPTLALAAENPDVIDGIILHGSFLADELPYWSLMLTGVLPERWQTGAPFPRSADPLTYIERVAQPKLFLHASQDIIAPVAGAQHLFALASEPKEFVALPNGHAYDRNMEPRYSDALAAFILPLAADPR